MSIKSYSSVAASNTSLFPENMAPSAVNDGARQIQADIRTWYVDAQWIDRGDSGISCASASSFKITGDVTGEYVAGRRLKLYDATTLYAKISSSSYSAPDTTVNVTTDSGSLTTSLTSVAVGILTPTNRSIPEYDRDTITVSGAAQFKGTITASSAAVFKTTATIEGASTLSGAATLKTTLTVEGETTFSGTVTFKTTSNFENLGAGGTFTASGASIFKTTVGVAGETTLSGTVTMKTVVTGDAVADQSAMETGTAVNRIVSPGRQHYHASAAKAWASFTDSGTAAISGSYNCSSVTDNGTGDYTINYTTSFSGTNYAVACSAQHEGFIAINSTGSKQTGSVRLKVTIANSGSSADGAVMSVICFGDQ